MASKAAYKLRTGDIIRTRDGRRWKVTGKAKNGSQDVGASVRMVCYSLSFDCVVTGDYVLAPNQPSRFTKTFKATDKFTIV